MDDSERFSGGFKIGSSSSSIALSPLASPCSRQSQSSSHLSLAPTDQEVRKTNTALRQLLREAVRRANECQVHEELGGVLHIEAILDSLHKHFSEGKRLQENLGSRPLNAAAIEKVETLLQSGKGDTRAALSLQSHRVYHQLSLDITKMEKRIALLKAQRKELEEKKEHLLKRQKELHRKATKTLQAKAMWTNENAFLAVLQNCFDSGSEFVDVNFGLGKEIHEYTSAAKSMTCSLASLKRKNRCLKQSAENELRHRRKSIEHLKRALKIMHVQNLRTPMLKSEDRDADMPSEPQKKIRIEDIAFYQLVSGMDAPESAVEFLTYLSTTEGLFPFEHLENLDRFEYRCSLELLFEECAALRRRYAGLEQVFQSLQKLRSEQTIAKAVQSISTTVMSLLNCDRASFWMVDKDHGYAWTKIDDGSGVATELKIPLDQGLVGHSVQAKSVLNIVDAYKDYRFSDRIDKQTGYRTQSVICVPIKIDEGVMAVVQASNKKDAYGRHQRFDEQDLFLLYVLGYTMTDVVIECEQLELDVQINRRKDGLITATGDLFLHCTSCEDLLGLLKSYLSDLFMSRDVALILICGDHVTRLTLDSRGHVLEVDGPKDKGLVGLVIETRRSVHIDQISKDKTYDPSVDLPATEGALHVWPLHRGRLLSTILQWNCPSREHVDFGDDGAFNQHNPRHADLLGKLMAIMQLYIEQWYPTTERLQSNLAQKVTSRLKATVRLNIQRRQVEGMVPKGARNTVQFSSTAEEKRVSF